MLIVGELRDLRNNKGIRDLTAVSLEILVSGVKHNVSNPVFTLCMLDSLAKVHDTAWLLLHAPPAHTSLLPLFTLLNAAFRQSVPSQILFSITPGFVTSN